MKLLVSPINVEEARNCLEGGADIIDVKNPREGSLGANYPDVIQAVRVAIGDHPLSAAIGDMMFKPGTVALAAYGVASCGVDYVKVGLLDFSSLHEAYQTLSQVKKSVRIVSPHIKIVAAGYADFCRVNSLEPSQILKAASKADCDVAMLDTAIKDGKGLFYWLNETVLRSFIEESHKRGMLAALAGSLLEEDLLVVKELGTDIVGVRGVACSGYDRNSGSISRQKVGELCKLIHEE